MTDPGTSVLEGPAGDEPASLYRRYRPRRFADVIGQEHTVRALTNALEGNRTQHAYLFSGTHGTGKTTVARIFAMALNCESPDGVEPCGTCPECRMALAGSSMAIIEIDAASNNGVDAVRDLIVSKAAIGSASRKKVYIVDEVHMLSPAASNALLKTLEEPPAHVVFILATTDPQKVLPTVRSRTSQLEFRTVAPAVLRKHLEHVAADAELDCSSDVIDEAVRRGAGSVRDALSALEVLAVAGIAVEDDRSVTLVEGLLDADVSAVLTTIAAAVADGREPRRQAEAALGLLREMFLLQMGASDLVSYPRTDQLAELARRAGAKATVALMEAFGDAVLAMRADHEARISLEVNLARYCRNAKLAAKASA